MKGLTEHYKRLETKEVQPLLNELSRPQIISNIALVVFEEYCCTCSSIAYTDATHKAYVPSQTPKGLRT
nr:hypothetical protein [Tanacetum cinerariifolium]